MNLLLLSVPFCLVSDLVHWPATVKFVLSFLAIVPLAKLLGDATEQVSMSLGQTLGGLLNATFGNAVELIVGIAALLQNQLRLVQTSMLGSILSNLLLVLGMSFFAGGLKFKELNFQATAALASTSVMTLACITLVIPAAYHTSMTRDASPHADGKKSHHGSAMDALFIGMNDGSAPDPQDGSLKGLLALSRGTAIILLLVYIAYLHFQLKTHADLFEAAPVVGDDEEPETPQMDKWSAGGWLVIVTVITAFCADVLVGSIDETATKWNIPKPFIGLILLPIVGNAAEHVTSIWMAMKGKMEITIGVAVGSSIQIAAGMIPILVIISWIMGKELTLFFADFETIMLFVSVLLVNMLLADGKAFALEGVMLIALYLVIALSYIVS